MAAHIPGRRLRPPPRVFENFLIFLVYKLDGWSIMKPDDG
jgi:hypothetical protein